MSIPIRCFSCGKVTGHLWEPYVLKIQEGIPAGQALTELGLQRPCCKRMLITHVPLMDQLLVRYAMDPNKNDSIPPSTSSSSSRPTTIQLRRMPHKGPLCPL